jgi:thiamine biosynthesis protein ThiS
MIIVNNRDKIEWKEGITITDVLKIMGYNYSMISVMINGEYVEDEDYDTTVISNNTDIGIFHIHHGG